MLLMVQTWIILSPSNFAKDKLTHGAICSIKLSLIVNIIVWSFQGLKTEGISLQMDQELKIKSLLQSNFKEYNQILNTSPIKCNFSDISAN